MVQVKTTLFCLLILSLERSPAVPVVTHPLDLNKTFAGDFDCFLPSRLGTKGTRKFIEECDGLGEDEIEITFLHIIKAKLR